MNNLVVRFALTTVPFLLYGFIVVGSVVYQHRSRTTRWPFKDSDRLRRSPGESLRRRIVAIDETFVFEVIGGIVAIWFAAQTGYLFRNSTAGALVVACAAVLIVGGISAFRIRRLMQERQNLFLGWFGERYTADQLRSLETNGFRVFHDVQGETGSKAFNIDHVVVGSNGVTVVETKTRRKPSAASGHEVTFNGRELIWPTGIHDDHGLKQVRWSSEWLGKWIFEKTGLTVRVHSVLTFPGWFVHETRTPGIRVVNPKILSVIIPELSGKLEPTQVDQIARLLDERCRDVAD